MLTLRVEGDTVIIEGLKDLAVGGIQRIKDRTLRRVATGVHRLAFANLSGPGGTGKANQRITGLGKRQGPALPWSDYGFTKKSGERVDFQLITGAGAYPVPRRTANLIQRLDFLFPGETKQGETGSFSAGPDEAMVYDSAEYAEPIHEGKGSSAKFGPRRYITDALEEFNQGDRIVGIAEEEVEKEMKGKGLA
jgi:hypothetical protein